MISEHQDKITYCSTPFLSVSCSNELHFLALLRLLLFSSGGKGEGGILLGLGKRGLRDDDSDPSRSGESSHCKQVFYFRNMTKIENFALMILSYPISYLKWYEVS